MHAYIKKQNICKCVWMIVHKFVCLRKYLSWFVLFFLSRFSPPIPSKSKTKTEQKQSWRRGKRSDADDDETDQSAQSQSTDSHIDPSWNQGDSADDNWGKNDGK